MRALLPSWWRGGSALLLLAAGCGEPGAGGVLGRAPEAPVVHLASLVGEILPAATRTASPARLLDLNEAGLARWTRSTTKDGVRIASPLLATGGIGEVGLLRLRLAPGGARRALLVPRVVGAAAAREDRAIRRIELSLERDAAPDAAVDLQVDLHEALHANLGDAARSGRLEQIELVLPGADPQRVRLEALRLEPRSPLPPGVDADATTLDQAGALRRGWAVRGGARVDLPLRVPAGAPTLRWSDGATGGPVSRWIEVVAGGRSQRIVPPAAPEGSSWQPRSVSLAPFAGQDVVLRLGADGTGAALFGSPAVATPDGQVPDVVLYLIDTLRGDATGFAAAGTGARTPRLDGLAREGVWFRRAQSSSSWTKPAIATLLSGILPTTHRVGARSYTDRMPASVPLVQEAFGRAGWRTGSFSASPLGSTLSALERGFEAAYPPRFWRERPALGTNPSADQLHEALLDWASEQTDRPFFAYVHTLEVHEWKLPRFRAAGTRPEDAYAAAVADADQRLGALLDALEERRPGRERVVVVVSDHGESWGDHGLPSHGFGLHQSQIHIPLVFWRSAPPLEPRVVDGPVSLADLAPTLLAGFGLAPVQDTDGVDLTPALHGDALARGPVLASLLRFVWAPDAPRQFSVTSPAQRVRIRREGGPDRSYDLVIDPRELQPLPEPDTELDGVLDDLLRDQETRARAFAERHGPVRAGPVTADESARLRALGYLEETLEEPLDGSPDDTGEPADR